MRYDQAMRLALLLVLMTGISHAGEHDATFAKGFSVTVDKVHDVVGYELPAGSDSTHVVLGRFDDGNYVGALVMKCNDTECTWRKIDLGAADGIEISGVVDLHGAPTSISTRGISRSSGRYTKLPGSRSMKFPVVAILTRESNQVTTENKSRKKVTGTTTRKKLYLISLIESDRASTVLMDTAEERGPTGRGMVRSYRLDKGETKGSLDVIANEQRKLDNDSRCIAPEPTEVVYALEERHYRTKKYTPGRGC